MTDVNNNKNGVRRLNKLVETTFDLNTDIPMETRFASLDANEIDDLAKLKHEKNTVRQTKWAVKLFKGNNLFIIFLLIKHRFIFCFVY